MKFRFHTKAIIYNASWDILVQQRADTWKRDLIGGKVEIPEQIEQWIIREITEETGIGEIKDLQILHIESNYSDNETYFVLCIFKAYSDEQQVVVSDEHLSQKRITKEELFTIDMTEYLQSSILKIKDQILA